MGKLSFGGKGKAASKPADRAPAKSADGGGKSTPPRKGSAGSANTPTTTYRDTFNTRAECARDKKKIADKCKPEAAQTDKDKKDGKPAKKTGIVGKISKATHGIDEIGRVGSDYKRGEDNAWLDSHCAGLWTKPMNLESLGDGFNKGVTDALEKLKSEKWGMARETLSELGDAAKDKAGAAATRKLEGFAARAIAKNVVGGAAVGLTAGTVGDIVEAGMLAWTVADGLDTAMDLAVMAGDEGPALLANFKDALDVGKKADELIESYKKEPAKALSDTMRGLAQWNPCMRAKRCQLVPMKETGARQAAKSGQGCCPGQTGHHLLPAEMFEDCPDYGTSSGAVHKNAPVVCTEGTNNTHGSHGVIHEKMEDLMKKYRDDHPDKKNEISNDAAIDAAVKSHTEAFKPPCDPRCLKAQLKDYYDKLCEGTLRPRGGKGLDTDTEEIGSGEKKGR